MGEADFHLALHCVVQSGVCQAVPCAQVFQLVWDLELEKRVIKDFGRKMQNDHGSDNIYNTHQGVPEVDPGGPARQEVATGLVLALDVVLKNG